MRTNFRRLNGFHNKYKIENQTILRKTTIIKVHQNYHQLLIILEAHQVNKVE